MNITCISDLHGYLPENLPPGDLLIVAGDLTARDTMKEHLAIWDWLACQCFQKVVVVGGNHDNFLQSDLGLELVSKWADHMTYLCDSGTEYIDSFSDERNILTKKIFNIWGSPWTCTFPGINPKCMAFTLEDDQELEKKWDLIPEDVDILVTHMPPWMILDQCADGRPVGSISLMSQHILRIKPKLHVFGHIHEQGAKTMIYKRPGYGTENNTICVNASYVNEHYKPVNRYMLVEL